MPEQCTYTEADIEKIVAGLQILGMDLKESIFLMPDSVIKNYLLFETAKIIEFKTANDFYYMQNKISRMMDLVIRFELEGKTLELLEEISMEIKKIVQYIEREREVL